MCTTDKGKQLRQLLNTFKAAKDKYYKEEEKEIFNVFAAMRRKTEEVALHSRFIASLLDPYAPHGLGDMPLKLFLDTIGLSDELLSEDNLEVQPGYEEKSEYNNIDILITSDVHAIIIENKIYHHDSNHEDDYVRSDGRTKLKGQLERYYHVITKEDNYLPENTEVVYLTPEGKFPSSISTGGDNPRFPELASKVRCISYQTHIKSWLRRLLALKETDTRLRYSIEQYITILEELTMNELEIQENKTLRELFGSLSKEDKDLYEYIRLKETDVLWHTTDELLHDIIRHAEDKVLKVNCVQCNDENSTGSEQYNQLIGEGLTNIISYNRRGNTLTLYFDNNIGISAFVGIESRKCLFIGLENKHINPETGRWKNLPQPVKDYLTNDGFIEREWDIIKQIQYEDEHLDISDLSGLMLRITNDEERQKYVIEVYKQFCSMIKEIEKLM